MALPQDYEEVEVTAPDGSVLIVEAPIGASDEQIFNFVRQNLGTNTQPRETNTPTPVNMQAPQEAQPPVVPSRVQPAQGEGFQFQPFEGEIGTRKNPLTGENLAMAEVSPQQARTNNERLFGSRPMSEQLATGAKIGFSDTTLANTGVRSAGYGELLRGLQDQGYNPVDYARVGMPVMNPVSQAQAEGSATGGAYDYDKIFRDAAFEGLIPGLPSAEEYYNQNRQAAVDAITSGQSFDEYKAASEAAGLAVNDTEANRNSYAYYDNLYKETGDPEYIRVSDFVSNEDARAQYANNLTDFRQAFDQGLFNNYGDYINSLQAQAANDSPVASILGQFGGSVFDPVNALGGGSGILKAAAINAATELGVTPLINANRAQRGQEEMGLGEIATNVAFAAGAGALLEVPSAIADRRAARARVQAAPQTDTVEAPTVARPTARRTARGRNYVAQITEAVTQGSDYVAHVTRDWTNAPDIEVRRNFNDLDGVDNNAIGVFNSETGRVSVNMEAVLDEARKRKLAPEDVLSAVTYHEGLGHNGMQQLFADRLDDTLWSFYDKGTQSFRTRVDNWLTANPTAYVGDPNRTARAVDEILAEWSEKGPLPRPIFDRLVNTVKEFGRAVGVDLKYSDREVRSILGMAHSAVVNGNRRDVVGNGFRYMYAGRRADTANTYTLKNAQLEAARGKDVGPGSPAHLATGWFKAADDIWRFEIDDSTSRLLPTFKKGGKLEDVLEHPALFNAYPKLRNVRVERTTGTGYSGAWSDSTQTIEVDKDLKIGKAFDTLVHEIQHAVQSMENMARGGNADTSISRLDKSTLLRGAFTYANDLITISQQNARLNDYLVDLADEPDLLELRAAYKVEEKLYSKGNVSFDELDAASERVSTAVDTFYKNRGKNYRDIVTSNSKSTDRRTHEVMMDALVDSDSIEKGLKEFYDSVRTDINKAEKVTELLDTGNIQGLRNFFNNDPNARFDAYEHLFGEVEARDTANRRKMGADERAATTPYTSEPNINPDNYVVDGQQFGPTFSQNRYMRPSEEPLDLNPEEMFEVKNAKKILDDLMDGYVPTVRTQEEAMAMARERGFNTKGLRKFKTEELDVRMYQADQLAMKFNDRATELFNQMAETGFSGQPKADYLVAMSKYKALTESILGNQAEVGRALAMVRALQVSRRKIEDLNTLLSEISGNNVSGFSDEATFMRFAQQVQALLSTGNTPGATAMVRKITKPYWWQYILTFRHASMLSGMGTHAKNFNDSAIMISRLVEEKALASIGEYAVRRPLRALGKDVEQGATLSELLAHGYGLTKALFDNQTWKNTWDAFMEGHGNRMYSARIEMQDARFPGKVGKAINFVSDALYAGDTFFRAFHDNAHMYALGVREAHKQGFSGSEAFQEGSSIAANADLAMIKEASRLTDEVLLVDAPSALSSWAERIKTIRPNMSAGEQFVAFAGNMLFPFLRVTDRLLWQALRRSPFAIFDKNSQADFAAGGARRDTAIARALMGTALIAHYWEMAGGASEQEEGSIQGQGPQNYQKQQALEGGGFRENAVIEDGQYVDATALNLSWVPWDIDNNVAAGVATLRQRYDAGVADEGEVSAGLWASARAFMSLLGSQVYADNLSMYTSLFTEGRNPEEDTNQFADFAGNVASQFVPAAVRQYNQQVNDPIKRVTTGEGSAMDRIYGRVASAIPGLSEDLPARRSVYGDTMPQGRSTSGMSNYTDILQDDVSRELSAVERASSEVVVSGAPASFQHEGARVKLTAEQRQEWQRYQGEYLRAYMGEWVASPEWRAMPMEEKTTTVREIREWAYKYAKQQMLPVLGLQPTTNEE